VYFGSKDGLIASVLDYRHEQFFALVEQALQGVSGADSETAYLDFARPSFTAVYLSMPVPSFPTLTRHFINKLASTNAKCENCCIGILCVGMMLMKPLCNTPKRWRIERLFLAKG